MAEQLICNQQVDGSTPFTSSSLYGGIPERPKGADCKSVVTDFAGPNPASPTNESTDKKSVLFRWWGKTGRSVSAKRSLCRIPPPPINNVAHSSRGILRNAAC